MDDQHLTAQLLRFFEFQQPLGQFLFVITFNVRVRVVAQPDEKSERAFPRSSIFSQSYSRST